MASPFKAWVSQLGLRILPQGLKVLQCKIFGALVPLQCTGPWAKFPRQGVLGIRKLGIFIAKWELGGQLGLSVENSGLLYSSCSHFCNMTIIQAAERHGTTW